MPHTADTHSSFIQIRRDSSLSIAVTVVGATDGYAIASVKLLI